MHKLYFVYWTLPHLHARMSGGETTLTQSYFTSCFSHDGIISVSMVTCTNYWLRLYDVTDCSFIPSDCHAVLHSHKLLREKKITQQLDNKQTNKQTNKKIMHCLASHEYIFGLECRGRGAALVYMRTLLLFVK